MDAFVCALDDLVFKLPYMEENVEKQVNFFLIFLCCNNVCCDDKDLRVKQKKVVPEQTLKYTVK